MKQVRNTSVIRINRRVLMSYHNGSVKRCTSKCIWIFWIECQLHHVMGMSLKDPSAYPPVFPVPKLNSHVIGRGKQIRKSWMDSHGPDVVLVCFKFYDLFHRVIVVDTDKCIVRSSDNPVLARNELRRSHCKRNNNKMTTSFRAIIKYNKRKYFWKCVMCIGNLPGDDSVTLADFSIAWNNVNN